MSGRFDNTSNMGGSARFQTTEWTKILSPQLGNSILAELYSKYWKPVFFYLTRKGFDSEQAKDLIQGFFSEKILAQNLLQKADRTKGKFRTFLLTSLRNYATDLHRKQHENHKLDDQIEKSTSKDDPEIAFDIVWAQELLQSVLDELETECEKRDKNAYWLVFRDWLLESDPNKDKMNMSEICKKYGVDSPDKAYNMIANLKGRFQKILRRRIRLQVDSDSQVDEEIRYFINLFTKYRKDFD